MEPTRSFMGGGLDSLYHFLFGVLATRIPEIIPLFLVYEALPFHNQPVYSLSEFCSGYFIATQVDPPDSKNLEDYYPLSTNRPHKYNNHNKTSRRNG